MKSEYRSMLQSKVVDGLAMGVPGFTRRDAHVPDVRGKAMAVIGMRSIVENIRRCSYFARCHRAACGDQYRRAPVDAPSPAG